MVRILFIILAVVFCGASGCAPTIESTERLELQNRALQARAAGNLEEAVALVRRMAALDVEHPWPYELTIQLHQFPQDLDRAEALVRSLGSADAGLEYGLARLAQERFEWDAARHGLERARERYERLSHPAGSAFVAKALAQIERRSSVESSRRWLEQARSGFATLGEPYWQVEILQDQAETERREKEYDKALATLERALALNQPTGAPRQRARLYGQVARIRRLVKDDEAAMHAARRSLEIGRELRDARVTYVGLDSVARTHGKFGRYADEASARDEAATIASQLDDPRRLYQQARNAGRALERHGDLDAAIVRFRTALEAVIEDASPRLRASGQMDLGRALMARGQYLSAVEHLRLAAEAARESGRAELEGAARHDLAGALKQMGELVAALLEQRRAIELKQDPADRIKGLLLLSAIERELGDTASAVETIDRALEGVREFDGSDEAARFLEALTLNAKSVVLSDRGDLENALRLQRRSLQLRLELGQPDRVALARLNLAHILASMGRHDEAHEPLEQALKSYRERGDRGRECSALNVTAFNLLERGALDRALAVSSQALELAREVGLRRGERDALVLNARILERAQRWDDARAAYRVALDATERQREGLGNAELETRFLSSFGEVYDRAVALELAHDKTMPTRPAAFELVERSRARGLGSLLLGSPEIARAALPSKLAERERALIERVALYSRDLAAASTPRGHAEARSRLRSAEDDLQDFRLSLEEKAPAYLQLVDPEPISLDGVRATLRDGETLLRYFVGPQRTVVWVITTEDVRLDDLGESAAIAPMVAEFIARASDAGSGLGGSRETFRATEKLSAWMLPDHLELTERLIVVPDEQLHRVPFAALRRGGRYLVQDHETIVVPSATALRLLRGATGTAAARGFLGVGDPLPVESDASFPELPRSGEALTQIAARFPERDRLVLRAEHATRERVMAADLDRFRLVHFATHGWIDERSPRRIGLRLSPSPGSEQAGFLGLEDVYGMRLSAELVVLSGCQTGLGELLPREGLVGFARGFLHAGSRSTMVTLWNISDRSTGEFMETFYRELDGRTVPDALRRAQLSFIESERPAQRQPYRWAPFVIVGDPGAMPNQVNPAVPGPNSE